MRPGYSLMGNYNRLPEVTMKMTTVKKGCKGEAVKQLQMLLGINADGIFGPKTKAAVIAYQTAHNLKPDGICGPLTWASLQGETIPASAHVKPVDYTPATGLTGTATITNAGTAIYSLERPSLAYGESMTFGVTVRPTIAITKVTTVIYPGSLSPGITLETDKNVAANAGASLSYTLQIPDDVYAAMTQRTHNAQIQITLTGANGTAYTTGRIECGDSTSGQRFKLAKSRTAPVISGVSWGESGTSHIST